MNKKELIEKLKMLRDGYPEDESHEGVRQGLLIAIGMIDQLLEPTEAKSLVVPKELGEWLAEQSLGEEGSLFSIIGKLEDMWSECGFVDFITDNKKQLIEVILGNRGYEVEKEKLYFIKVSENQYARRLDGDNIDLMLVIHEAFAGLFTEQEIKKINPNLMVLAVEVAE